MSLARPTTHNIFVFSWIFVLNLLLLDINKIYRLSTRVIGRTNL